MPQQRKAGYTLPEGLAGGSGRRTADAKASPSLSWRGSLAALSRKRLATGRLSDYASLAPFAVVYGAGILVLDQRLRTSCYLLNRVLRRART